MHILDLAAEVKAGTDAAGLVGMRFNTIGVSDGISMGTEGMSYSLQSRDLIADSMETVVRRPVVRRADRPARLRQEHARLHHGHGAAEPPGIMVYGGTIRAGHGKSGAPLDIVSAFQSYGEFIAGSIDEAEREDIVRHACPGPAPAAACTRPTPWPRPSRRWHVAALQRVAACHRPRQASTSAAAPARPCAPAGADIKPSDIMTRAAFDNALAVVMALGGSTNAVLHLIAMARAVGRAADAPSTTCRPPATARPFGRSQAERQVRDGRPARRWAARRR
jgi:dihydroxy-acid dehydratase